MPQPAWQAFWGEGTWPCVVVLTGHQMIPAAPPPAFIYIASEGS